jgi:hypothetical protein
MLPEQAYSEFSRKGKGCMGDNKLRLVCLTKNT